MYKAAGAAASLLSEHDEYCLCLSHHERQALANGSERCSLISPQHVALPELETSGPVAG